MNRETEIELVARVLDMQRARTTSMAEHSINVPATDYTSDVHHAAELRRLFGEAPVLAALSVDLPEVGDRITLESGGVPLVVTRASDGQIRAYVNVCRHRGAPLADGPSSGARSFTCPFHGWVYDLSDGRLLGQPRSCDGFAEVDPESLSLRSVPVAEGRGLIVVRPMGDRPIDIDEWAAGLGPELGSLHFESLTRHCRESRGWECNWKLLLDTFLESYHVFTLHRESLSSFYLGIASPFDAFGQHNRLVIPQSSIISQAERPSDEWELLPHSVVQYLLAPNVIVSNLYGYVMTWRFVPQGPGSTTVEHTLYTYTPVESDLDQRHFDQRFEAARSVTSLEDFPMSERVHRSLCSGVLEHITLGRNEPAVIHFHQLLERSASSV
jgi:phenylpropionate dioxygenase-like ring-hydroxylating dioxygenase large terminal subunit